MEVIQRIITEVNCKTGEAECQFYKRGLCYPEEGQRVPEIHASRFLYCHGELKSTKGQVNMVFAYFHHFSSFCHYFFYHTVFLLILYILSFLYTFYDHHLFRSCTCSCSSWCWFWLDRWCRTRKAWYSSRFIVNPYLLLKSCWRTCPMERAAVLGPSVVPSLAMTKVKHMFLHIMKNLRQLLYKQVECDSPGQ